MYKIIAAKQDLQNEQTYLLKIEIACKVRIT